MLHVFDHTQPFCLCHWLHSTDWSEFGLLKGFDLLFWCEPAPEQFSRAAYYHGDLFWLKGSQLHGTCPSCGLKLKRCHYQRHCVVHVCVYLFLQVIHSQGSYSFLLTSTISSFIGLCLFLLLLYVQRIHRKCQSGKRTHQTNQRRGCTTVVVTTSHHMT